MIILSACNKKPDYIDSIKPEIRYVISIADQKVSSYLKYEDDHLVQAMDLFYDDTAITRIITQSDRIVKKTVFFTGGNKYPHSSIDSFYKITGLSTVQIFEYEYNGETLIAANVISQSYQELSEDLTSVTDFRLDYESETGNITGIRISGESLTPPSCTDRYQFSDQINRIDIENFSDEIIGKKNANLVKHIDWHYDCFPFSSTLPVSDISYSLNEDGYVVEKIETYIPSHSYSTEEIEREITLTKYEYVFK
ncbi:MAG: hypothetical protein JW801_09655 [Bacteroidales bacterium]|nr:hypothetical protein [Bacteroidales bacterium]